MTQLSPLRRRMIEDMTVRNLSPATQQSYVYAVAKFGQFFKRSPERLGLEDVRAFQVHLVAGGISWPALNQTVCALRFLYGVTLGQPDVPERIPHAREPRKLPVVLSADEVVRFLEAVASLKCRAALTTAYAAGLRAAEVASLKVANINSSRMVIRVEQGKGGKDRYVMLSAQLLGILSTYWRLAHPGEWLFPGRDRGHSIHPAVLHAAAPSCVGLPNSVLTDLTWKNLQEVGAPSYSDETLEFGRQIQRHLGVEPMADPFIPSVTRLTPPEENEARLRASLPPWQKHLSADDYVEYCWHAPTVRLLAARPRLQPPSPGYSYPNWAYNALGGLPGAVDPGLFVAGKTMALTLLDLATMPEALSAAQRSSGSGRGWRGRLELGGSIAAVRLRAAG